MKTKPSWKKRRSKKQLVLFLLPWRRDGIKGKRGGKHVIYISFIKIFLRIFWVLN